MAVYALVTALPVVPEEEGRELLSTLIGCVVGTGIGPFAQRGLDEALDLAIGLRSIRPDAFKGDAHPSQGFDVTPGFEGWPVVRHHALDRNAVAAEEAQGIEEEDEAGASLLVGINSE